MTAADLIRSGACTSACVAAITAASRCTCPCAGEHHGLLAHADVTTLIDGRRSGRHRHTDLDLIEGAA